MSEITDLTRYRYERAPGTANIYYPKQVPLPDPELQTGLTPSPIEESALISVLRGGNENYSVAFGPSGNHYETLLFNADKKDKGLVVKPSTSFSSARKNPANVLEVALAAAANPETAYLYVASFGNTPTHPLLPQDRGYFRHTGRYSYGDGSDSSAYRPMPSLEDMAAMIEAKGLTPTAISADEEAGRVALGLMAALPKDSIQDVYLNGLDGISETAKYVRSQFFDDMRSRVYRRRVDNGEVEQLTPTNISTVKDNMPTIYDGARRFAHLAPLPLFLYPRDVRAKINLMLASRKHKDLIELEDHAVYHDMLAALDQQEATITMQFNADSKLSNVDDCLEFGALVMGGIQKLLRSDKRGVEMIIGQGGHNEHADNPMSRIDVESRVLRGAMKFMARMTGGKLLYFPKAIPSEAPQKEVA